jgi:methyl-accepting chemotaxis protein
MIRIPPHKLVLALLATACVLPAHAFAQGAAPARTPDPAADSSTAQDREMLALAEQLADQAAQILESWIATQAITEDRLFARVYFPVPKTEPYKYTTMYDEVAQRDLPGPEDRVLGRSATMQYAIVTDINAYVPAQNTRFSQPLTGNMAQDYTGNRTKRMLGDLASFAAARSEAHSLLQRVRLETGDLIYDVSVPVMVRGKHWGCVRIGYRRTE